ncbi:MAG TPA: hypothetical protein VKV33_00470 [Streptosporangiaceae bacterium]|nr:hypothetical protein [Streptosporangiaceae bacterium]
MTTYSTVRIAHAEARPGRLANGEFQTLGHLVVLADDAGRRAVPIWMRGDPGAGDLSPVGFAFLGQEIFADGYRGATAVFRARARLQGTPRAAGLFLRVMRPLDVRGALTEAAALADPSNHIVTVTGRDWADHEVTAPIPEDANTIVFGVFLAGPGRIEFRAPDLARGA